MLNKSPSFLSTLKDDTSLIDKDEFYLSNDKISDNNNNKIIIIIIIVTIIMRKMIQPSNLEMKLCIIIIIKKPKRKKKKCPKITHRSKPKSSEHSDNSSDY